MVGNSGQCLRHLKLYLEILILTLSWISSLSDATQVNYTLIPVVDGGWEKIDPQKGWPTLGTNQFVYIAKTTVKISLTFDDLDQYKDEDEVLRLKFKFWAFESNKITHRISSYISFDENEENVESLIDRYRDFYNKNWMPYEFTFRKKDQDLISISTTLGNIADLVAFKEIKLEKELNELTKKTINSFNIFKPEIQTLIGEKGKETLYFANDDCKNGCEISLKDTIQDVQGQLLFEYLMENADVEPNSINKQKITKQEAWKKFNDTIKDLKSWKMKITTKSLTDYKNETSYIAIRKLKFLLNDEKHESECGSIMNKCPFKFSPTPIIASDLHQSDEKFYYTKKSDSSIDLTLTNFAVDKDKCLSFEYHTATHETELIFSYTLKNDNFKQVFFTSMPLSSTNFIRHETLCLSNFFLLKNINDILKLQITVRFNQEWKENKDFYIKSLEIRDDVPKEGITKRQIRYLKDFDNEEEGIRAWIKQDYSNLNFKNPNIVFSAKSENTAYKENEIKMSQISSEWIIYDNPENFIENGELVVWDKDGKAFNSFILSAKVCNSISNCKLCSLEKSKSQKSNSTHFYYEFNFQKLNIAEHGKEYIRLVLTVKYVLNKENNNALDFNIKVLNFGYPCYNNLYCKLTRNGKNVDCPQGLAGPKCSETDYCDIRIDKKKPTEIIPTGNKLCDDIVTNLKHSVCISENNKFRCECKLDYDDKYGPISTYGTIPKSGELCAQPLLNFTNWDTALFPSRPIQPKSNEKNNLKLSFKNISIINNDICIKFDYQLDEGNSTLFTALYNQDELFEITLQQEKGKSQSLEFCLLDFRTSIDTEFLINIKLNSQDYSNFDFASVQSKLKDKSKADLSKTDNLKLLQPDVDTTFKGNSVKTNCKALLTTPWINNEKEMKEITSKVYLHLEVKDDFIDMFSVNQFFHNNKNAKHFENEITFKKDLKMKEHNIKLENDHGFPFRVSFEIFINATKGFKLLPIPDYELKFFNQTSLSSINQEFCKLNAPYKFNNITKDMTANQYCGKLISIDSMISPQCILQTDKSFRCTCPNSDFKWDSTNSDNIGSCIRKEINQVEPQICLDGACKFMSRDKNIRWSNPNIPRITDDLPFYFANKNNSRLMFNIRDTSLNISQSVCFNYSYFVKEQSTLRIKFKDLDGIDLGPTINSEQRQNWVTDKICGNNQDRIGFEANFAQSGMVAVKISKEQELVPERSQATLPFLTIGGDNGVKDISEQWQFKYPYNGWTFSDNKQILFKGYGDGNFKKTSYLISNIIKNDNKYKSIGFKIPKILSSKNLQIKVVLFDNECKIIETVKSIMDSDLMIEPNKPEKILNYKFNFTNLSTVFRHGFIIEYTDRSSSFSLINVNVNDPCITDENSLNTCNNHNGTCERNGVEAHCKCNQGWMGESCESKDWCNVTNTDYTELSLLETGNDICKSMANSTGCRNGQKGFICECVKEYFWDDTKHNCRSIPGCLDKQCGTNEICMPDSNDQPTCVCAEYFVNINYKKNISGLNCQKFDWCKNDHIDFIKTHDYFNYNDKYKRECKYKCEKMSDDEYGNPQRMCSCPSGTAKIGDECKSIKCIFPTLNNCDQICKDNATVPDGYKCECQNNFYELKENSKCVWKNTTDKSPEKCKGTSFYDENKKCICRENYEYINDKCEPDINKFNGLHPNIIAQTCPNKFERNGTELMCKCNDEMELNSKTKLCEPKALCSVGSHMFELCSNKSAVCTYDESKKAICDCPPGFKFNTNNSEGVCVGICELIVNGLSKRQYCDNINAICDTFSGGCICKPGLFMNEKLDGCEASSKTVQFKISIKNPDSVSQQISSISKGSKRYKRAIDEKDNQYNQEDFKKTYEMSLVKKKEFVNNNDRKMIITKNALQVQLFQVLQMANRNFKINDVAYDSCVMKDKNLECNVLLDLPKEYSKESLNKYLKDSCHSKGNDCFFYQNGKVLFTVDSSSFDTNKIQNFQPCVKNRCDNYADCQPNNGLYSCHCNNEYFSVAITKNVKVRGSNDPQVLQTCQMKELCETKCKTKTTDKMNCRQFTHFNESQQKWSAEPECYCAEKFNLVSNNNQRQCTAVCKDISCNSHGKCLPKGLNGFACECDDGWSGAQCETEHKIALGGWIAGIVILALLVVVVSGIAFVYYRRSSNGGYSGSGHQMDDYSGHSFRTGQSRGPSQGTDNPSFHRN